MGMRVMEPETDALESKDDDESASKLNDASNLNGDSSGKLNQATEQLEDKANSKRRKRKKSQKNKLGADTEGNLDTTNKRIDDIHPHVPTSAKKRKKQKSNHDVAYVSVPVSA